MEIINDTQYINGLDSISYTLAPGAYQWAQNVTSRGGMLQTRQGLAEVAAIANQDPRGCGAITISGVTWLLVAAGENIYKLNLNNPSAGPVILKYPGTNNPVRLPNPGGVRRMVHFELCVQAQESRKVTDGYKTVQITPRFVMIIQDGAADPHYWDGVKCDKVDKLYPSSKPNNTPKAQFMKFVGDRLWTFNGRKVRASNLLNPFQNTEELITASGGFFYLPDNVTGVGITHDFKSLLAFTHFTTSAFQVGIEDRTAWPNTQDFQRVIFPSIGCVAHRTIINMYGMTWWMSQDGWVGLDNTLSAFQSSRLDVQDQNMSRSKEGINWAQGGGAAGSYGNFLFVSVPSANKWNQHTWLMDQAPLNTLAGIAPPVWSSNITGIRPEQWMTCQVGGQQRCFCVSRDLTDQGHQATIWEAFIGQRMDVPKVNGVRQAKDIGCAVETRFVGLSPSQYSRLRWIEVDCAEIIGDVQLQVYYCGRRTSYKKIIDTHLTATVSPTEEEVLFGPVPVYVPQYRTIRSVTDASNTSDNDPEIQTDRIRNIDREFSALVMWSGQMGVSAIRFAVDPEPDYMEGVDNTDEYLSRRITAEGSGAIGSTLPPPNAPTGLVTSKFMSTLKPRWVEFPAYDSAVPNGVFFVAELTATPAPGAYPSNSYPIDVNLTSETQAIDIYYTRDNTKPDAPPHQHGTHYPPRPHITIGQRLRAIGARDGMRNSVELNGLYTQSKVAEVTFDPPGGNYPPDTFAQPNHVSLGPLVSYNFNEGTGTVVHDFSGGTADGTTEHTTWTNAGKHSKGLVFNGTNAYVYFGRPAVFASRPIETGATWSAWVKASADPSTPDGTIVSKGTTTSGWILKTTNERGPQKFCIAVAGGTVRRFSVTDRALDTWYHVAGVYNTTARTLDIYVNGVLDNGILVGAVPSSQPDPAADFSIGKFLGSSYFNGVLDDVRIYNHPQTITEITADMNVGVSLYVPPPSEAGFAVRLSTATPEADIRFAIGGPVTESSQLYDPANPIHPYAEDRINARAYKQYYLTSDLSSAFYHALPRCEQPTCTPPAGAYPRSDFNPTKTITLATSTTGATLRYTINSEDFDLNGHNINASSGPVAVHPDDEVRVKAMKQGLSDSQITDATYTTEHQQVETPVITPNSVTLSGNVHEFTVQVTCATPNVTLYYEIFASDLNINPTHSSPHIDTLPAPIFVGPPNNHIGSRILRVMASRADMDDSLIAEATFDWDGGGGGR